MNGARDQFLARPAFAGDQHGGVGGRNLCDLLVELEHGGAGPDQDLALGDDGPERTVLLGESPPLQATSHGCTKRHDVHRLGKVVRRPAGDGVHGGAWLGIGGYQNHGGVREFLGDRFENLQPAGAGHLDVAQHEVKRAFAKPVKGLATVGNRHHVIALVAKDVGQKLQGQVIVFGDQNLGGQRHIAKTIMQAA